MIPVLMILRIYWGLRWSSCVEYQNNGSPITRQSDNGLAYRPPAASIAESGAGTVRAYARHISPLRRGARSFAIASHEMVVPIRSFDLSPAPTHVLAARPVMIWT